jgi:hypothetical protein
MGRIEMKNIQFLLVTVFCLTASANANDSAFSGVSGTPKPIKGEHRSISMQSEKIVIVANDKTYDTTVDFIFRNDGPATTVQMGFPESSYGDVKPARKSAFLRFSTWVDGEPVPAKRVITTLGEGTTEAYWLKTVRFGRKQTRQVRVSYASPMGGNTSWGTHRALNYAFTGQNWKGKVERSDLEIHVNKPGLWIGLPLWGYKPLEMNLKIGPEGAIFRKTWRNWQAQGEFTFGLTSTVPFWMWDKSLLQNMIGDPKLFEAVKTFRVGTVPDELPQGVQAPPAFTRNGTAYISLSHFKRRMSDFADDLEKYRKGRPRVDLKWDAKSGVSTLSLGNQSFNFVPSIGSPAPILLRGKYENTLYVPLVPLAEKLSLTYQIDPQKRLFEIKRGSWTGK